MPAVSDFLSWLKETIGSITEYHDARIAILATPNVKDLNVLWDAFPDATRNNPGVQASYVSVRKMHTEREAKEPGGFPGYIEKMLTVWLDTIKKYETTDPKQAIKNLSKLTADVMVVAGASAAVDVGLGMLPNSAGTASATNTKELMKWLGMGAVLTAVAHDPVKIGLLRPYQDSLEQTFRNRRPDDMALFQAYRTRELSPIKVDDLSKLNDTEMNRIETDNDTEYFKQISRWGYSEAFALSLSRSATRTLGFSQLVTLARAGIYDKGLAIYSLWGEGLDRVVMSPALQALETLRDREMYSGFRSMIEPSYVDGLISEADLLAYWTLAGVPDKVQSWVLPRMRLRRVASQDKARGETITKEKDLTVSQLQLAYQDSLIDRAKAKADIISLGYDAGETDILLNIAELRRKTPSAARLKRLTLTDYEKAFKNKIISLDQVLERMQGEYAPADIAIERKLLEMGKA